MLARALFSSDGSSGLSPKTVQPQQPVLMLIVGLELGGS